MWSKDRSKRSVGTPALRRDRAVLVGFSWATVSPVETDGRQSIHQQQEARNASAGGDRTIAPGGIRSPSARDQPGSGHLVSWKAYVGVARLALAAGLGSEGLWRPGCVRVILVGLFGARLIREMSRQATNLFTRELKRFWSDTGPRGRGVETGSGDHA